MSGENLNSSWVNIFSSCLSPQVNESLSQLYVFTQSFRLHVDWLKTARQNVSLSSTAAESISTHLLQLSNLLTVSLNQVRGQMIRLFYKDYSPKNDGWISFESWIRKCIKCLEKGMKLLPKPLNLHLPLCPQISEEVPQSPTPSLPVVSTTFDAQQFSVEISEWLRVFHDWSKRVLRTLKGTCRKL